MPKANTYPDVSIVKFYGEDASGNFGKSKTLPRGNIFAQSSAPSSLGNPDSVSSAFGGDLSNVPFATGKSITGAATLEQPTSGYVIRPENSLRFEYISNPSGFNSSTSGNGGRTGVAASFIKADSLGQGDTYCYYASGFVSGARAGATIFLASPAVTLLGGSAVAGSDGVYLNAVEIKISDAGFDVAGINFVANQVRSNDTGALGAVWYGYRSQSQGTAAIDAHFSAVGKCKMGLDLTGLETNGSGAYTRAAIALKSGDRIYFNGAPGAGPGYGSLGTECYLWVESGALKFKGASGTTTTLGAS